MRTVPNRWLLAVGGAVIGGLILLVGLWTVVSSRSATVQDSSFHFTFCELTHGTNHTVSSGIPLLGSLNRALVRSGRSTISRDAKYSWDTPHTEICLSIGFRHDGDVLKVDPTNGGAYPDPMDIWLLQARLVRPDGCSILLAQHGGSYGPYNKEYVNYWLVPGTVTNVHGSKVQFSRRKDGRHVATYQLP